MNGFYIASQDDFQGEKGVRSDLPRIWDEGDRIHIQIDMTAHSGRIWIDKDKDKDKLFEIDIPESLAIFVDSGHCKFGIAAIHQHFRSQ